MAKEGKTRKQTKIARSKKGKAAQKRRKNLRYLRGEKSILVLAPHGVMGDDNNTNILAEELNSRFGCYAVINEKYRKPSTGGNKPSPKKNLLDLNIIDHAEMVPENQYLSSINEFINEIIKEYGEARVFHLHGIKNNNIKQAAQKVPADELLCKTSEVGVLIGYGQRNRQGNHPLTATEATVESLIHNLEENGIHSVRAPVEPIEENGESKYYCGWDTARMNQYFRGSGLPLESIQLEIKESGFRKSEKVAREAAKRLGKALVEMVQAEDKVEHRAVRTTLSEKSEERRIEVNDIDLLDTRFKSRVSEYGVDQQRFNELTASIRSEGILNNIIVRKISHKNKYQLISGFRRLAALKRVYEEQGRKDKFLEVKVPAKIFKSLSDDDALRISFSENLARKDLTLWEMANYCRMIAEELSKQGKSQGEIEAHLAALINRDDRTVRRYLALSSITNEQIRRDLHNGTMDASIGTVFTRQGLREKDKEALYRMYKSFPNPPSFDSFDRLARNALKFNEWSGMKVENILAISTAPEFLSIDPGKLKERVEYLSKAKSNPLEYVLARETGNLKNSVEEVKSKDKMAPFTRKFSEKASAIEKRISNALKAKKMLGEVAINPIGGLEDRMIRLTVAAPVSDLQKALQFTLKELKDEIGSLENLFKRPPKASFKKEEVVTKKRVKIDDNATIAFTIKLKDIQDALRILIKDGTPIANLTGQILIRATSDDEVQFGRSNHNRLLINKKAEVHRQGATRLSLKDIYTPIIKSKGSKDTECEVTGVDAPSEGLEKKGTMRIKNRIANFKINIPTGSPDELVKLVDVKPPAAASIQVDASDLRDSLSKVLGCINPREVRKPITGVLVKIDKTQLIMVGTNGVMLNEVVRPHNGRAGREIEWIMEYQTGKLLRDVLGKQSGTVGIRASKNNISFQSDNLLLIGELITNEEYPDYGRMFRPADSSFRLPISKLRDMASSISLIANPEDNHRMTINVANNAVVFKNEKGKAECHCDSVKGTIDLDVNSENLAELAKTLEGNVVEVRHRTGINCIALHPDGDNQRAFLMIVKKR